MESCAAFNKEVSLAIKKVSQIAGWVLRVFRNKDKIVLLTLFKTMVLPHLEYCCQLCSPVQTGQIQKLESVPRSFTAKVNGLQAKTYWERLKTFNIYSLLRWRQKCFIIYVYKIIVGAVKNLSSDKFKIKFYRNVRRGRLCFVLPLNPQTNRKIRQRIEASFSVMAPRLFDSPPSEIRDFKGSMNTFKVKLESFLKKVPEWQQRMQFGWKL